MTDWLAALGTGLGVIGMVTILFGVWFFAAPPIVYAWKLWHAYWERKWRADG